jgi:voltage-gated potassium channel
MKRSDRKWLNALGPTALLLILIALSLQTLESLFFLITLATVLAGVAVFHVMFPGSRLVSIALTNFLAIYACLFVFFVETNFQEVSLWAVRVGFPLPIAAFLGGALWRRAEIRQILNQESAQEPDIFWRAFRWLVPIAILGAFTFLLPGQALDSSAHNAVFLAAMAVIAAIVFWVSADVCAFLIETGLLFEEFFHRLSGLFVPAFTFFTFYTLNVIVFAAIYRIVDRLSAAPDFMVIGEARDITFLESLYFSIITLSTVGYGDIVPLSSPMRVIISVQIVVGVMLLLFGFSEIISFVRERRADDGQGDQ